MQALADVPKSIIERLYAPEAPKDFAFFARALSVMCGAMHHNFVLDRVGYDAVTWLVVFAVSAVLPATCILMLYVTSQLNGAKAVEIFALLINVSVI